MIRYPALTANVRSPVAAFAALTVAAVVLGLALQIGNGFYEARALAALVLALLLAAAGVFAIPAVSLPLESSRFVRTLLAAAIVVQLVALFAAEPGLYLRDDARLGLFRTGLAMEAVLIVAGATGLRPLARWWFAAVLAINVALGVWMLKASPNPRIDVVEVHKSALRALGLGRNPYTITFRNIYGRDISVYNPQAVVGNRVNFGYPYPPLNLLAAVPGHVLLNDYRYSQLAALVAAAALIGYAGASAAAQLAGVLLLTTPRVFFVLEQGWTEPVAVLVLAATMAAMIRRPLLFPWLAGLLLVTKQYLGLAGPLLWKCSASRSRGTWRFLTRAVVAGSIVTLPFLLWNVQAFIDAVVLLQTKEPFRIDSLSLVSWAARAGWGRGSFLWAVGAALVTLGVVLWRAPNTPAGFAASLALSSFAMFAMGSKAFCNYYFFVIGALCCTLAALAAAAPLAAGNDPHDRVLSGPGQTEV